jgi:hypothetical protein
MNWRCDTDGIWRHEPYAIYRYARDFSCYRWGDNPKLLGKCESLLEAQLLASIDAVLQTDDKGEHVR